MTDKPIAGVDIAKDWLDICVDGAGVERLANSAEAVGGWLDRVAPGLVAFEPTGGHERLLIAALRERGITLIRVHPTTSSPFARAAALRPSPARPMPGSFMPL